MMKIQLISYMNSSLAGRTEVAALHVGYDSAHFYLQSMQPQADSFYYHKHSFMYLSSYVPQ